MTGPERAAALVRREYERTVRPLYDQIAAARRLRNQQLRELQR